jgi:hypothetical protein
MFILIVIFKSVEQERLLWMRSFLSWCQTLVSNKHNNCRLVSLLLSHGRLQKNWYVILHEGYCNGNSQGD